MKKVIFALAAVVALAACSNEQTVTFNEGEAIGFNTFVGNSTRSVVDPSYTNTADGIFGDFQVYGYVEGQPLFNDTNVGVKVSKTFVNDDQTNTIWDYAGTQYWIPGADYNFSAVAPATNGNWTKTAATSASTTLEFVNDGQHDLLYAQTATIEGKATGNDVVGLTFRHVLSKVKFSFKNDYNADNTKIIVRDIKINNGFANANVELTDDSTTWSDWATNLELNFGGANTTTDSTVPAAFVYPAEVESHYQHLLIPYNYGADTNAKLSVTFWYDIVVSSAVVASFEVNPEVAVNLQPGYAYDFKATITPGEPIEFTVTEIIDWDEDHDGEENTEDGDTDGDNQVDTPLN